MLYTHAVPHIKQGTVYHIAGHFREVYISQISKLLQFPDFIFTKLIENHTHVPKLIENHTHVPKLIENHTHVPKLKFAAISGIHFH